jgi:hypothetical protein
MLSKHFSSLKTHLRKSIEEINETIEKRNRKISLKDIIFYTVLKNANGYNYSYINLLSQSKQFVEESSISSLKKRRLTTDNNNFKILNDKLVNFIYRKNESTRIIAVDGTYIPLPKIYNKLGYKLTKNGSYCSVLISCLYDIDRELVINYSPRKDNNERLALLDQLSYLRKGDILIMDRGYYSKKILFILHKRGINVIFRLKKSYTMVKELINTDNNNLIKYIHKGKQRIKFRILRYEVDGKKYYLGTNIHKHYIKYFKDLYWKRWKIETNFRYSKYNLCFKNLKSKNENKLLQDIYAHQFVLIVNSYFQYKLQSMIKEEYQKINTSDLLLIISNDLIYDLFYNNLTTQTREKINTIFNGLLKQTIKIVPNRQYPRITIGHVTKWHKKRHNSKMNRKRPNTTNKKNPSQHH